MQNPEKEIAEVVSLVTAAINPEVQQASVLRYYAPDASFRHPLCTVPSAPNSRDKILGILQWYRVMSPVLKIEADQVTYDEGKKQLFIDAVQEFHIRWSPLRAAPARLIVHLTLRPSDEDPNLFVIAQHEDFYHPEDLAALVVPPLIPLVRLLLRFGTLASVVNARVFGLLGYWAPAIEPESPTPSDGVSPVERPKAE
ncbi:hypothetical protein BDW22DRAFT_1409365 [Trametopsis cervina]|nr:hypothetical protein BDW22DRAFT_1409365 [Trametopsis cervina]